jgi:hypothetical protein
MGTFCNNAKAATLGLAVLHQQSTPHKIKIAKSNKNLRLYQE